MGLLHTVAPPDVFPKGKGAHGVDPVIGAEKQLIGQTEYEVAVLTSAVSNTFRSESDSTMLGSKIYLNR